MGKSNKDFKTKLAGILILGIGFSTWFFFAPETKAEPNILELQSKIEQKNRDIKKLNEEISKYQSQLQVVSKEANTLQNAVKSLDLTQDKLLKDIKLTESKKESTNLNLSKLVYEIEESEDKIDQTNQSLGQTLRLLNEAGESSMIEVILKYNDFSSFWDEVDSLQSFQIGVKQNLENLKTVKQVLEDQKNQTVEAKNELEQLKVELDAQNKIVEINKDQKQTLLKETKNTEAEYKKILAENLARKAAFEKELFEFESQLRIAIDPTKIQPAGPGVLSWPLDSILVTQFFGKTVDSKKLYVSGTHNGVDFRASMGTPVKASLSGVVSHVGNTDEVKNCKSFGKWILLKHNNGLTTLYSHLSSINVSVGQAVETGKTIAFSGGLPGSYGAGYSTGPHLHFGVYATEGLRPQNYQSSTPCSGAYMPLADLKAYLDPMSYLPPL